MKTSRQERIRTAVKDKDWIEFRYKLKGRPTIEKLDGLSMYFEYQPHKGPQHGYINLKDCDTCIRVDNYIKALCRGGQLRPGASLSEMLDSYWSRDWIKE